MVLQILGRPPGDLGSIDAAPGLRPPPIVKELMSRDDSIITFYSFKGGTGRSMALANVAWILAANGYRVLVADWDVEAPGLYKFFQPFLDAEVTQRPGIVDFIRRFAWAASEADIDHDALMYGASDSTKAAREAGFNLVDRHIKNISDYVIPLNWQFPSGGIVGFLSSGKQTNGDYVATLSALDWDNFYDNLFGGQFFDGLRLYFKREWDYVLIDSRAGFGDVADICTVHLPDIVIDCFTLGAQAIDGAAMIAETIRTHTSRNIRILPVPMRIDDSHKERSATGLTAAVRKFPGLPEGMSDEQRRDYWNSVGVPHRRDYSYGELLAVFGDPPGSRASLLASFERIAGYITNGTVTGLPPMDEKLRMKTKLLFIESGNDVQQVES
jgi:hypothetical protein